jgi:hypothetical protein
VKSGDIPAMASLFRPALWPFIWAHALTGFIAAHGKEALGLDADSWLQGLVAGGHWAVLLGGSAAALTAVFSGQCGVWTAECGVNEERQAPQSTILIPHSALRNPQSLAGWIALALLLIGLGSSPAITWWYFDAYLIGVILVAVYAAPPLQISGLRIGGIAAQAFGYGALTFYSGYAASNDPAFRTEFSPLYFGGFIGLFVALQLALKPPAARCRAPYPAHSWGSWLYWLFLAGGFGCLAAAEIRLGNRFGTALLIVPLAGWCVAGLRRDRAQDENPPLSSAAALGLCLATDAGVALASLLR